MELQASIFQGKIRIPASKSYSQRAVLLASIAKDEILIQNLGQSKDEKAMLLACEKLGAKFSYSEEGILITPIKKLPAEVNLQIGESGLGSRILCGLLLNAGVNFTLHAEGSLLKREQKEIEHFLEKYAIELSLENGRFPLKVKGRNLPKILEVDGSQGSQFASGLLFGFAINNQLECLKVKNLVSKPYIDMTLEILKDFGFDILNKQYEEFSLRSKQISNKTYQIESDWSSASCWIAAAAIFKKETILIEGLSLKSKQADKKILDALVSSGAKITWEDDTLIIDGTTKKAFEFDATDCPDLFPALALLATKCEGKSKIIGTTRLKNKESDRAQSIFSELTKAGVQVELEENCMYIEACENIRAASFSSHNDHRIAMMCAFLGAMANETSTIDHPEAVEKSYPSFWQDYRRLRILSPIV